MGPLKVNGRNGKIIGKINIWYSANFSIFFSVSAKNFGASLLYASTTSIKQKWHITANEPFLVGYVCSFNHRTYDSLA